MKVGTWNMQGKWSAAHEELLRDQHCDVLLLTEVSDKVTLDDHGSVRTTSPMAPKRAWAGVFSTHPLHPLAEPHAASAAATVDGITFCSSVLPWKGCGGQAPWEGENHADRTGAAVESISAGLPPGDLVWGGDWNHALCGSEHAGSKRGRQHVLDAVDARHLDVPTWHEPHRLFKLLSIDHIAVPHGWPARCERIPADGLSDHDAYVVELDCGQRAKAS